MLRIDATVIVGKLRLRLVCGRELGQMRRKAAARIAIVECYGNSPKVIDATLIQPFPALLPRRSQKDKRERETCDY